MKRRRWVSGVAVAALAACTYKEYNSYYEVEAPDASSPTALAGAGGRGPGGAAGASTAGASGEGSVAGAAGNPSTAGAGGAGSGCTGCLRLTTSSNTPRNLRLELDGDQNLSQTQLLWRMRVPDFDGNVNLTFYAQSGIGADEEAFLGSVNLAGGAGWQELGADLATLPPFSLPVFIDAGGAAGGGFDPGFPFDKSEVERVGVVLQPDVLTGVFTPITIEIDSVTFSNRAQLDSLFSSSDAGFQLVEANGASSAGATLVHVGG